MLYEMCYQGVSPERPHPLQRPPLVFWHFKMIFKLILENLCVSQTKANQNILDSDQTCKLSLFLKEKVQFFLLLWLRLLCFKICFSLLGPRFWEKFWLPSNILQKCTYAFCYIFQVKGGEGRIQNADESLTYRFEEKSQSWTIQIHYDS